MKGNFILEILAGAFSKAGELEAVELLQHLHDTDPAKYEIAITAGSTLVSILLPMVEKTKTKIDDSFVGALSNAINTSVASNVTEL